MINNIHKKLHKTHSAFAEVSMAAIIIWIGDILCVLADIGWLIGDMHIQVHPHHYWVGAVLLLALIMITGSGIWLYKGVNRYLIRHERHRRCRKSRIVYPYTRIKPKFQHTHEEMIEEINRIDRNMREWQEDNENDIDLGGC